MQTRAEISRFQVPDGMFTGKRVLISAYMSSLDVGAGMQGDATIIESLIGLIKKQGGSVIYTPYSDYGITGKLVSLMERLKKKSISNRISGTQARWMYTAVFHFLTYALSKVDIPLKSKVRQLRSLKISTYILFYPYLFPTIVKQLGDSTTSTKILFEVNIERKFFEFQFSRSRLNLSKNLLVRLVSRIESESIDKADEIMALASRDAKELSLTIDSKPIYTLPAQQATAEVKCEKQRFIEVQDVIRMKNLKIGPDTLKVTFMGSNYSLNVRSVRELIILAKKLTEFRDRIKFLVVGNVHRSFDQNLELPENVIFTGHLDNFNQVMSASDFFLLIDHMRTGVEVKSRVYSMYPSPTLVLSEDTEEYQPILKEKLIPFSSVDSIEKFLRKSSIPPITQTLGNAQDMITIISG